jgi:hypothetical protein
MGFDALFFARLDYQDKNKRMNEKSLEWIWMPSVGTQGSDVKILAHSLFNHYSSPSGFNYDILDNSDPWINDVNSEDYNAPILG